MKFILKTEHLPTINRLIKAAEKDEDDENECNKQLKEEWEKVPWYRFFKKYTAQWMYENSVDYWCRLNSRKCSLERVRVMVETFGNIEVDTTEYSLDIETLIEQLSIDEQMKKVNNEH